MTFDADDRVASWSSDGVNLAPAIDLDGNLVSGPIGTGGATISSGSLSGLDWGYVDFDSDFDFDFDSERGGVGAKDGVTIFQFDYRGSTLAMSDGTGTVTHRVDYSPYGQMIHAETLGGTYLRSPFALLRVECLCLGGRGNDS